ncbi:kelch-like protein 40 [Styela clava]
MYTGEANPSMESVENTLYVSQLMQLDVLSSICFNFMENNLSVQHCLLVVKLARLYNRTELETIAERFIVNNFESLILGEDFLHLSKEELVFYLQKLDKKHEVVWHAVRRWISNKGEKIGSELMENCHFGEFPHKFLLTDLLNDSLVQSSPDAKSFVIKKLLSNIDGLKETKYSSEKIKWEAALKWAKQSRRHQKFFSDLFGLIKLQDFSYEFIRQTVRNEPLVQESHKCKDLLLDILHAKAQGGKLVPHIAVTTKTGIKALNLQTNQWSSLQSDYDVGIHLVNVEGRLYASDGNKLSLLQDGRWTKKAKVERKSDERYEMVYLKGGIYIINRDQNTMRYDIAKDRWDKNLPSCDLGDGFCAAASDEFIYAMGGWAAWRKAKVYDRGIKKWSPLPQMSHQAYDSAAVVFQSMVYVLGGDDIGYPHCYVQCYNPTVRSWTEIAVMAMCRQYFSACVVDNKMYAVGGDSYRDLTNSIETFNEKTGKWEIVCEMDPLHVQWLAVVVPPERVHSQLVTRVPSYTSMLVLSPTRTDASDSPNTTHQ